MQRHSKRSLDQSSWALALSVDSGEFKENRRCMWRFIAINKSIEMRTEVLWAKLLIKLTRNPRPSVVNILEGGRSFEL